MPRYTNAQLDEIGASFDRQRDAIAPKMGAGAAAGIAAKRIHKQYPGALQQLRARATEERAAGMRPPLKKRAKPKKAKKAKRPRTKVLTGRRGLVRKPWGKPARKAARKSARRNPSVSGLSTRQRRVLAVTHAGVDAALARAHAAARKSGRKASVRFGAVTVTVRPDGKLAMWHRDAKGARWNPSDFEKVRRAVVASAKRRGYKLKDPSGRAIAAAIGRKKLGQREMTRRAVAGKRAAAEERAVTRVAPQKPWFRSLAQVAANPRATAIERVLGADYYFGGR